MAGKRKKHTKRKFKSVEFKLSARQMKSLRNYCAARKTTPTKLIKMRIRDYTEHFSEEVPKKYYATPNQLKMFDDEKGEDHTLDMFD